MKLFPIAAYLIVAGKVIACHDAAAQTSGCSAITNANDRLACYDKAAAVTGGSPDMAKTALSNPSGKRRSVVEMLADENAKLTAKLKSICRGC
ncbi:hypothetical protein [Bradyrhizobium elkanii]|uniref:hypothetical protein n=1 Tax=Bradyrhizobium elkanii TaxID=29448 RepID=UPI0004AF6052|nr:hypothetical protein [Bradyrhizobium elkanii]WLA86039.1 hypothetical protein QNJ99_18725 [Bradyrhizobium elkanii]